jgi:DNA-binding winged helix-turn-helix (wHTH) protein/Tfp pilus assembly protein PilF
VASYVFDDFRLDVSSRALSRGEQAIELTPRAFDTLLYLVQRGGKVVDKDELMLAMWPRRVVEENNLYQVVSILRHALGERQGTCRYIQTVPGRGYRFIAQVSALAAIERACASKTLHTLAVLPFKMLSTVGDEVLEFGMADTLITRLNALGALVVRPLSAVRRLRARGLEPLEIGRKLGVDAVLEGSIQKAEARVRVNMRLLGVVEGRQQWADIFDAPVDDLFALQDLVAEKAASALALRLNYDQRIRLTRRSTDNPEAWRCFALARFFLEQRSPSALKRAVQHFQQALSVDPDYALAYAGLSDAWTIQGVMGACPPQVVGPPARESALCALAIDEQLPGAHYALGHALAQYDRDWTGAEQAYRRALELDPNCTDAHHRYAILLMTSGRQAAAFAQIRRARELDPTSLPFDVTEGFLRYWSRSYESAIEHLRIALDREPHFWMTHYWLAQALGVCGEYAAAATSAQRANELLGNNGALWLVAWVHAAAGRRREAETLLGVLLDWSREHYVPSYDIAQIYAGLGDIAQAFAWLERAWLEHSRHLDTLAVNPIMDALRRDPRMAELCVRIGLQTVESEVLREGEKEEPLP